MVLLVRTVLMLGPLVSQVQRAYSESGAYDGIVMDILIGVLALQ